MSKYKLEIRMKNAIYSQIIINFAVTNNLLYKESSSPNLLQFLDNGSSRDFAKLLSIPSHLSRQKWFMENVKAINFFKKFENEFKLSEEILPQILEKHARKNIMLL